MTVWAIVPVKPFKRGKSRLKQCLGVENRYALNYHLFLQTLEKLQAAACFDHILVVSGDSHALMIAREANVHKNESGQPEIIPLRENRPYSLNSAITQAMDYIAAQDNSSLLIIPTDLPLLRSEQLRRLAEAIPSAGVLIVPDHFFKGTNALGMGYPNLLSAAFGENSFQKHCRQALDKNVSLRVYYQKSVMQDLDNEADLSLIKSDYHLITPVPKEERTDKYV